MSETIVIQGGAPPAVVVQTGQPVTVQPRSVSPSVVVAYSGPPGPPGSGQGYEHVQSTPSTEWIINHNFGQEPLVLIYSPGGQLVVAEVVHISPNQTRAYFNQPQTGKAIAR